MNKQPNDLSKEIISTAEKNGAILIGTTKIYEVESVIVIGTPFNENWRLRYFLSEAKRIYEEHKITKALLNSLSKVLKKEGFKAKYKNSSSIFGDFRPLAKMYKYVTPSRILPLFTKCFFYAIFTFISHNFTPKQKKAIFPLP